MEPGQSSQHDNSLSFYERILGVIKNLPPFFPLAMVAYGLLVSTSQVDNRFYGGNAALVMIVGLYLAISILYLLNKWHLKKDSSTSTEALFAVIFHTLTAMFVLFISGFLNAFLVVWLLLMTSAYVSFRAKGYLLSFLALCVTALSVLFLHAQLSPEEQMAVLQGTLLTGSVAFIVTRIMVLRDHAQNALAKTRDSEQYQHERLLALINSMGDAVAATDEQGVIKVYNSTMLSLLDTNIDLNEKNIDQILQLRDKDNRPLSIITEAKQRKTMFSRNDVARKLNDGDALKLYVNVAPIQPGYQSHTERGYIIILRDITKEKSLEEERDEFVSVVSHELRTPVTIAEGNLSNIQIMSQRGAEKTAIAQAVNAAHEQIVYLSKLVNDLSTLAKAERGTGGQAEVIDLKNVLQEAHKEYSAQATAKRLQFNLDIAPNLPSIRANVLYLEEVMQNLITNAIKYTQAGSVTLKAHLVNGGVSIEVTDSGIGISKSDQTHVFEKFYRSEDYRTRESNGTGLGLYVCKKLAEKQGFKITMQSRLNHGSTFSLIIPASHVISAQVPTRPQPTAVPAK